MEKQEVFESYKQLRKKLHSWSLPLIVIYCVLWVPILFLSMILWPYSGFAFYSFVVLLCLLHGIIYEVLKPRIWVRICRRYEGKWGMTYEEIKEELDRKVLRQQEERAEAERQRLAEWERNRKLAFLQREEVYRIFPLIQQLCKLNVGARREQEAFLTERFTEDVIPFIFDTEYSEEQKQASFQYWVKQDLQERRKMVETLFKLTVLEDGIRNNEWNLLMQIMGQLKFNNYYIDYFKKRYASLRTEFDEYQRSSTSSANYSASYLKLYYSVLGLQEGATDEEIKRAYHELAMQHHPDRPHNAGRIKECEAMMAKLNEAYEKVMG